MIHIFMFLMAAIFNCYGQCPPCENQTSYLTVPLDEAPLPYRVTVNQADFMLPAGLHSFAFAVYEGEWLLISGRTNGLHDVDNTDPTSNPFPTSQQNTLVYVINPTTQTSYSRSLYDSSSNLSQAQIDLLSVTNALFYYADNKKTLYLVGGYGIDTASNTMGTKASLTAIDIPNLIKWVKNPKKSKSALACMRFTSHPLLQLTGGVMLQSDPHKPFLLAFGQNFNGNYTTSSNGAYSQQIRPIQILDNGRSLSIQPYTQPEPLPYYRRRDLNVVPVIKKNGQSLTMAYTALSGVFTSVALTDDPGAWTIPIEINSDGSSQMLDPNNPNTFAQAMNNYSCANIGLYSQKTNSMYTLLFGGISAAMFSDGSNCNDDPNPQCNCCTGWVPPQGSVFTVCCNLPFTNDITTIEIDKNGIYRQYLMSEKFPIIQSFPPVCQGGPTPLTCEGQPLDTQYFFGSSAAFIPNHNLPTYPNGVIAFDKLKAEPIFIGYIVGGIASTITDTNCGSDSQSSNYVFRVTLQPQ